MDGARWPDFVRALPVASVPVPGLDARVVDDGACQVALFDFAEDAVVAEHIHADKWGILVAGQMTLSVAGSERPLAAGDSYFVPAGVPHGAQVVAGSRIIEIFGERRFDLQDPGRG